MQSYARDTRVSVVEANVTSGSAASPWQNAQRCGCCAHGAPRSPGSRQTPPVLSGSSKSARRVRQQTGRVNWRLVLPLYFGKIFGLSIAHPETEFDLSGYPFKESNLGHQALHSSLFSDPMFKEFYL